MDMDGGSLSQPQLAIPILRNRNLSLNRPRPQSFIHQLAQFALQVVSDDDDDDDDARIPRGCFLYITGYGLWDIPYLMDGTYPIRYIDTVYRYGDTGVFRGGLGSGWIFHRARDLMKNSEF